MEKCKWVLEEEECAYETSCGDSFILNYGSLKDNGIKFCCFCGLPIEEVIKTGEEE